MEYPYNCSIRLGTDRRTHWDFVASSGLGLHGITEQEYLRLLKFQNYYCALCDFDASEEWAYLVIDHDHTCDHEHTRLWLERGAYSCRRCVRGLLCYGCNALVGAYESGCRKVSHPEGIPEYLAHPPWKTYWVLTRRLTHEEVAA